VKTELENLIKIPASPMPNMIFKSHTFSCASQTTRQGKAADSPDLNNVFVRENTDTQHGSPKAKPVKPIGSRCKYEGEP
jgi:hypothetical protein